ncbi:GreA/GreB family elongation factor [Alteromonas sp. M12]|uniref:GreA/GreB family elongation factor n=1 Tax=Alteromonas sp. M12 TaxID=3135644 RepID=UPI00319DD19A
MHFIRSYKTLICRSNSKLQKTEYKTLMDPIRLCWLLGRLEFCANQTSRLENRVRIGSNVILKNLATEESLELRVVNLENANLTQGLVPFTSAIGASLLGLRCGDVAQVNTPYGSLRWQVLSVNNYYADKND